MIFWHLLWERPDRMIRSIIDIDFRAVRKVVIGGRG